MNADALQKLIDATIPENDRNWFLVSGHFLAWFSVAEMSITAFMAMISGVPDLAVFHTLTSGMDARVKLNRLRELAKKGHGIGPNLAARLAYFERPMIGLRNKIAHGAPWQNETATGRFHFITIESFQSAEYTADKLNKQPDHISAKTLLEHAEWLRMLSGDFSQVYASIMLNKQLEIDQPMTQVPQAKNQTSL